jgi:hypothetical protein
VAVSLGVSVRGTQEHEIEYELLGYGKELDRETNPEPSDLVPRSRRWQLGFIWWACEDAYSNVL